MTIEKDRQTDPSGIMDRVIDKIEATVQRIGDAIPYVPVNGKYPDKGAEDICWWTNGFWPGILWQLYHYTGERHYARAAETIELRLDRALEAFDGLHHDVGFMWLHSAVADFRLTGNERSKIRGLHAATILAGRYNIRGKFIRSWNDDKTGWVIIDSMMNIPILYWASRTTSDPRFAYIAEAHGETLRKTIVRGDGSCNHIVVLDPADGSLIDAPGGQGYAPGSSWTRGQAWALYGFALSYRHSGNVRFLETAKSIAHYFISHISSTGFIPAVDFRAPSEPNMVDTTAGVCAACGLLELSEFVPQEEKDFYSRSAEKILTATAERYCNWDKNTDGIVTSGTTAYHDKTGIHVPIIYGDYFFIEGILRLMGKYAHLW